MLTLPLLDFTVCLWRGSRSSHLSHTMKRFTRQCASAGGCSLALPPWLPWWVSLRVSERRDTTLKRYFSSFWLLLEEFTFPLLSTIAIPIAYVTSQTVCRSRGFLNLTLLFYVWPIFLVVGFHLDCDYWLGIYARTAHRAHHAVGNAQRPRSR